MDFLQAFIICKKDTKRLFNHAKRGHIKELVVNEYRYKYPLSKKQLLLLDRLEKDGIIITWNKKKK